MASHWIRCRLRSNRSDSNVAWLVLFQNWRHGHDCPFTRSPPAHRKATRFPTRQSERIPSPFMGDAEAPINIWQWTADFDANARGYGGFADNYPHTEGVWYFPQDYDATREVRAWRGTEPVIELVATGWGTLERKVTQNILGVSKYRNGGIDKLTNSALRMWECHASFDFKSCSEWGFAPTFRAFQSPSSSTSPRL